MSEKRLVLLPVIALAKKNQEMDSAVTISHPRSANSLDRKEAGWRFNALEN